MAIVRGISHVAIIGNHPPRMCGIATFTQDVREALIAARPGLQADLYAMDEPAAVHDYPAQVICQISQNDIADYRAAARRINDSGAQIVCVQHEYGIFGGPAGAHLLALPLHKGRDVLGRDLPLTLAGPASKVRMTTYRACGATQSTQSRQRTSARTTVTPSCLSPCR